MKALPHGTDGSERPAPGAAGSILIFDGVSRVGLAFRLGTIRQGPLHIWDGGGLVQPAALGWPVTRLARLGGRPPGPGACARFRFPTVRAFLPLGRVAAQEL